MRVVSVCRIVIVGRFANYVILVVWFKRIMFGPANAQFFILVYLYI